MRFMGLLKADNDSEVRVPTSQELLENMGRFMEEATKAGVLRTRDGLQPNPRGARVKLSQGKVTVTNGPFPETKGQIVPCAMFEVDSVTEAVQWTMCFLKVLGEGECELRPC